jgi:Asp-tRNA(Asn)/Glu-tRNA(Gln) amidotransferase A subunit family amidase
VDQYRLTIHELRDLIRSGEASPVEAVQSYLGRIDAVEERVRAFNRVTGQAALAASGTATATTVGEPPSTRPRSCAAMLG